MSGDQGHINIFEQGSVGDASHTVGELDEIIASAAGLLAAKGVGEGEWLGELTSAHQESGAVDGPLTFRIHSFLSLPGGRAVLVPGSLVSSFVRARSAPGGKVFSSEVTLRAVARAGQFHKNGAMVEFWMGEHV